MEDFQEQEYEFLRRLEDERVGRRTLVKRGLAVGAGLTVMSLSPAALAARKQVSPPRPRGEPWPTSRRWCRRRRRKAVST